MPRDTFAIAYILWGGQYDARHLELIEDTDGVTLEDVTGGHMLFTVDAGSIRDAKTALARLVFLTGESGSFIDFGTDGVLRDCDPQAFHLTMDDPHYHLFAHRYNA